MTITFRRVLQLSDFESVKALADIECEVPAPVTESTGSYVISSELVSSPQIKDYNEFDDDSEQIENKSESSIEDSFEQIAIQPSKTTLPTVVRDFDESDHTDGSTKSLPRVVQQIIPETVEPEIAFKRGHTIAKQADCEKLKLMAEKEVTVDFIPMIDTIETDAKAGTVKIKVNLSGNEQIGGDIYQYYSSKLDNLPFEAVIQQR